jgi:predicted nucleotidyltransferase
MQIDVDILIVNKEVLMNSESYYEIACQRECKVTSV